MVASILVPSSYDIPAICALAGNADARDRFYVEGRLVLQNVSQGALEAALASYDHLAFLKEQKKLGLERAANSWLYGQFTLEQMLFAALAVGTPADIATIKQTAVDRNQALRDAQAEVDAAATEEEVAAVTFADYLP